MGKKQEAPYFKMLVDTAAQACKAMTFIQETFADYDPNVLAEKRQKICVFTRTADIFLQEKMAELSQAFITPIDREDMGELLQKIGCLPHTAAHILDVLYMLHIQSVEKEALTLSDTVAEGCRALQESMERFPSFRKNKKIEKELALLDEILSKGNLLYVESIRVQGSFDTKPAHLYAALADCLRDIEEISKKMRLILLKNR